MTISLEVLGERVENVRESMLRGFAEAKSEALEVRLALKQASDEARTNAAAVDALQRDLQSHLHDSGEDEALLIEVDKKLAAHLIKHTEQEFLHDGVIRGKADALGFFDKALIRLISVWGAVASGVIVLHRFGVL